MRTQWFVVHPDTNTTIDDKPTLREARLVAADEYAESVVFGDSCYLFRLQRVPQEPHRLRHVAVGEDEAFFTGLEIVRVVTATAPLEPAMPSGSRLRASRTRRRDRQHADLS